jgi:bifunctional UDP-N-acetylglucosamine pyrophosphorylase/glucosamine-1-phosphate N-acetyltransferase
VKVVFICGGTGKKMYPLTKDRIFLDLLGRTLLQHQIILAQKTGLTKFVVVGNPGNIKRIDEMVSVMSGISVETAVQKNPLGIANALEAASQYLDDEIIVVNPNDIFDSAAYAMLLLEENINEADSYLFGYRIDEYFPGDYLVIDDKDYLSNIVEEPAKGNQSSNMVNVLIHMHSDPQKLLEYAAKIETGHDDAYELALGAMTKDGQRIKVIQLPGLLNAIKYPWHIPSVVRRFFTQFERYIAPTVKISDRATVEGQVIISNRVKIMENATVRGPVYIGPGTVIGTNSLVQDYSHIGANCNIGFSTEIKGSYIGDNNHFHMNYIGDSIIGENCNFGAGTILANFRFDKDTIKVKVGGNMIDTGLTRFGAIIGDNCSFGINTSVMPGVKVSPNSIVGPQKCV